MLHTLKRLQSQWLASRLGSGERRPRQRRQYLPCVERLENRWLPTTIVALPVGANNLIRFDALTPNVTTDIGPVTNLVAGDTLVNIDFRPATGGLYGLGLNGRQHTFTSSMRRPAPPAKSAATSRCRNPRA